MKVSRNKFPFKPEEDDFESNSIPTKEDVDYLSALIRENKIKEFEDFVNKKMTRAELDAFHPGEPTRDYLASALEQSILKRYPKLNSMSQEQQVQFLKNKVYPGLTLLKKNFDLSNKITTNPEEGSLLRLATSEKGKAGDININPYAESFIDDALHELSHSVDQPIKTLKQNKRRYGDKSNIEVQEKAISQFIEKNPKFQKSLDSGNIYTTPSEGLAKYRNIGRTPNFEDYDWKAGEFSSDVIGNPIDKYKEVGGEHHLNRTFSLDNLINFVKGDLKDIVKNEDRFKTLRKKLS